MTIDFNGEPIEVELPDGYYPTNAVILVRAQSLEDAGSEYLAVGASPGTGGLLQHGMLAMASSPDMYAVTYEDDDD